MSELLTNAAAQLALKNRLTAGRALAGFSRRDLGEYLQGGGGRHPRGNDARHRRRSRSSGYSSPDDIESVIEDLDDEIAGRERRRAGLKIKAQAVALMNLYLQSAQYYQKWSRGWQVPSIILQALLGVLTGAMPGVSDKVPQDTALLVLGLFQVILGILNAIARMFSWDERMTICKQQAHNCSDLIMLLTKETNDDTPDGISKEALDKVLEMYGAATRNADQVPTSVTQIFAAATAREMQLKSRFESDPKMAALYKTKAAELRSLFNDGKQPREAKRAMRDLRSWLDREVREGADSDSDPEDGQRAHRNRVVEHVKEMLEEADDDTKNVKAKPFVLDVLRIIAEAQPEDKFALSEADFQFQAPPTRRPTTVGGRSMAEAKANATTKARRAGGAGAEARKTTKFRAAGHTAGLATRKGKMNAVAPSASTPRGRRSRREGSRRLERQDEDSREGSDDLGTTGLVDAMSTPYGAEGSMMSGASGVQNALARQFAGAAATGSALQQQAGDAASGLKGLFGGGAGGLGSLAGGLGGLVPGLSGGDGGGGLAGLLGGGGDAQGVLGGLAGQLQGGDVAGALAGLQGKLPGGGDGLQGALAGLQDKIPGGGLEALAALKDSAAGGGVEGALAGLQGKLPGGGGAEALAALKDKVPVGGVEGLLAGLQGKLPAGGLEEALAGLQGNAQGGGVEGLLAGLQGKLPGGGATPSSMVDEAVAGLKGKLPTGGAAEEALSGLKGKLPGSGEISPARRLPGSLREQNAALRERIGGRMRAMRGAAGSDASQTETPGGDKQDDEAGPSGTQE
ncbi:unnamed protein product [Pedinophyceae sp. YPF-701]|nr:unnamed protein product [Pedinophyceae sp. YPF-701]